MRFTEMEISNKGVNFVGKRFGVISEKDLKKIKRSFSSLTKLNFKVYIGISDDPNVWEVQLWPPFSGETVCRYFCKDEIIQNPGRIVKEMFITFLEKVRQGKFLID